MPADENSKSLQERYAPNNACWGCGPANAEGLRIRSFPHGEDVVAECKPEPRDEPCPALLLGGMHGQLRGCRCTLAVPPTRIERGSLVHAAAP